MDQLKPILERRSCRSFTKEPVPANIIETLLRSGMYAPSAKNSQPWEFLVITDEQKKDAVCEAGKYWSPLKAAPLGILVMANLKDYKGSTDEFFIQDCSAATQNILLSAHALGLGAVWLGLYPKQDLMKSVREVFAIPEEIIPFSLIAAGYPAQMPHPHTSYHEEMVHYNKY